jgi:hypothetical protein
MLLYAIILRAMSFVMLTKMGVLMFLMYHFCESKYCRLETDSPVGNNYEFYLPTPFTGFSGITIPTRSTDLGGGDGPTKSYAFADLNNDGKPDFMMRRSGKVLYFKNTGTTSLPHFTFQWEKSFKETLSAGNYENSVIFLIDVNNDKKFDIVSHREYWLNSGSITAPIFADGNRKYMKKQNGQNIAIQYGGTSAPVDIDNDGDVDLIATYGSAWRLYENIASTPTAEPTLKLIETSLNPFSEIPFGTGAKTISTCDVDKDGDADVFTVAYTGAIEYYENIGSPHVPIFAGRNGGLNPFNSKFGILSIYKGW